MVEGARTATKSQSSANNKSFSDQNQTKIVLRRLPPTLTSEQFLEIVSPLPDHDYYRFCKPDYSMGQQYAFCRAYLNIPNRQDLIVFTEKFQGYVFVDKNGTEYNCSVEYAPSQSRPKTESQLRKDPKVNSFEQDPEYQAFVANMNAPLSASEALPNAETILEEIEKKQREIQESKHKAYSTTTPLLEFLKRKRDEKKQEKLMRIQQNTQRRNNKQASRNNASNPNEEEYNASMRYGGGGGGGGGGDRSNRHQRGYEKNEYRNSGHDQKRSNANDFAGGKSSKNRDSQQNPKSKQQQPSASKEPKTILSAKSNTEESPSVDNPPKREVASAEASNTNTSASENTQSEERPRSSNKVPSGAMQKNPNAPPKNRPSMQMYNPGERARLRKQQNPSS